MTQLLGEHVMNNEHVVNMPRHKWAENKQKCHRKRCKCHVISRVDNQRVLGTIGRRSGTVDTQPCPTVAVAEA